MPHPSEIATVAEELLFSPLLLDSPHSMLVEVDPVTADRYSRIAATLRAKGRPIPTNDVWIAAHAMETGADLISGDSHFEHIDGIVWIPLSTA